MRKTLIISFMLLAALSCAPALRAQDDQSAPSADKAPAEPVHYYRLIFTVQELGADGKPVNSRSYATTASTGKGAGVNNIRAGSKVPVVTSSLAADGKDPVTQYQYIDLGINFDIRNTKEEGHQLSLNISAQVSSYEPTGNTAIAPVIRNNSWNSPVLIPIGKPTIIFSSDSLETKGAMQVIATATPIAE
jgi:hypothetical protein